MRCRTGSFTATDDGGAAYLIEVWREVRDGPHGVEYGPPGLRWGRTPVTRVAKGAYRIEAADSPTGRDAALTSRDPSAP